MGQYLYYWMQVLMNCLFVLSRYPVRQQQRRYTCRKSVYPIFDRGESCFKARESLDLDKTICTHKFDSHFHFSTNWMCYLEY